jgi:hypothetical protein
MLLFREVYGWLRYLLAKDPICNSQGIVVEEISSTYAPMSDTLDGVRTLVIHNVRQGMTPRLEIRWTGLHPQIYFYGVGAASGILLSVSNQYGFTGDYKSWDCSDLCQWLLKTTKEKLCDLASEDQATLASTIPVTAKKILDYPIVRRILDAVIRASKKGTRLTREMINKWLKENEKADLWDFAISVVHWFDKNKVEWKDIEYLEDERAPGKDIIDWSWLKRQLNTPERIGKLPPPVADRVHGELTLIPSEAVLSRFKEIITRYTQGAKIAPLLGTDCVRFGRSAIASLKAGDISFQYLQQLETCDPNEIILPWSFIRRSVLSYSNHVLAKAEEDKDKLADLILTWLKDSHLLLLLYKGDSDQEDAISKALQVQLKYHIKQTLENRMWVLSLLQSLSEIREGSVELSRALQVDFDLWLLDALSPAVSKWKIPLSPHAFSIEQKDQKAYDKMYKVWVACLKDHLKANQAEVKENLKLAFEKFFKEVITVWRYDDLKEYKAKIPSASKVLNAIEMNNKEGLLQVLIEDFESEVGSAMPSEIKEKLLASPYFNTIMREVKLQGLRLD